MTSDGKPSVRSAPSTLAPWLLLALIGAACASGGPASPRRAAPVPGPDDGEAVELRSVLELALRGSPPRDSFRAFVECRGADGMRSVELFGTGVGIWERGRQFAAGATTVDATIRRLLAAGFASFEPLYGKRKGDEGPREVPQRVQPPLVVCRIAVTIGGVRKQVVQVDEGERFEPLLELARGILDLCAPLAEQGIEVTSLEDGLDRMARGALAPESWQLLLHVVPERRRGGDPGPGLWLKLEGIRARARPVDAGGRFGELRETELTREEVSGLARELGGERPGELPSNLWAEHYTSLSLRVLDRSHSIQARRFAGMAAGTHGERQRRFDRVVGLLGGIYERVRRDGRVVTSP